MSAVARLRRSSSLRSFHHAAFARMAAANAVSVTGTWMQTIAQSWVVFELTGSTTALGGSVAVQAAPPVLLGLWGGAVVDRAGIRHGLGHLREHPGLVVVIVLSFFLSSFGRNFQVTMAAMTGQVFELDAAAYGRASTAFAVGALAGAILATRLRRPGISALLVFAAVAAGLQVLAGMAPGMRTFSTVILAVGAAAVVVDTVLSTHVQLTVAEAFRGRALAVVGLVGMAGSAVGAPLLGFLADVIGARGALLTGGAVAAAATGLAWMLLVDRTSTPAGGPPPRPRPTMGLAVGRSRLATPTGT